MSKKNRYAPDGRNIDIRAVRRKPPDIPKLSRALIALAMEQTQAEIDAEAEHAKKLGEEGPPRAA